MRREKMYCTKCGKEVVSSQNSCVSCGAKILREDAPIVTEKAQEKTRSEKEVKKEIQTNKWKVAFLSVLGIILVALIVGGGLVYQRIQKIDKLNNEFQTITSQLETVIIPKNAEKFLEAKEQWKLCDDMEVAARENILKDVDAIKQENQKDLGSLANAKQACEEYQKQVDGLMMNETEEYNACKNAIETCLDLVAKQNVDQLEEAKTTIESSIEALILANDESVEAMLGEYADIDLSRADASDIDQYNQAVNKITELTESRKYSEIMDVFAQLEEIGQQYIRPDNPLLLGVQQMDVTEYPNVKLYMNITDEYGNVVDSLENGLFYIRKKNAEGKYIKQVVKKACQLNEIENLNINMVADVSGSMNGVNMEDAKSAMREFVNSVQFYAGDQVEVTAFSDHVTTRNYFTNDAAAVQNSINMLNSDGGMTALYDTLFVAVDEVAAKEGAKCVIAFTDGFDNQSYRSANDVASEALRYHVPVFIVSVGGDYNGELAALAQQTGGIYQSISYFNQMTDFYNQIYRQEKQLYMVEFEDTTETSLYADNTIVAGYHSSVYGGEVTDYSYIPYTMISVESMRGREFSQDDPVDTMMAYIVNFATAMTQGDYSYISSYVRGKFASEIKAYVEQLKYDEDLANYEITSVDYKEKNKCVICTRETYYIYDKSTKELIEYMTQLGKYVLTKKDGKWKIQEMPSVDVVNKIYYNK